MGSFPCPMGPGKVELVWDEEMDIGQCDLWLVRPKCPRAPKCPGWGAACCPVTFNEDAYYDGG